MSRTAKALVIKYIMTLTILVPTLAVFRTNTWDWLALIALFITVVNYLVGDVLVLPSFGNAVASVGDGLMAALTAHIAGVMIPGFRTSSMSLFLIAFFIAIGEFFFHRYLYSSAKTAPK
jgi:hypothetical protein